LNLIWRLVLFFLGQQAKRRALREMKKRGVVAYMKTLQGTRYALMGALAAFCILQIMALSLLAAIACGVWLLDLETDTKLQILLGCFGALFALPFLGLIVLFSERLWYKASGAQKMVDELRAKDSLAKQKAA
jgi:hypothetical protein